MNAHLPLASTYFRGPIVEQKNWKEVAGTVNDPHLKRHPITAPMMGSWRSFLGPGRSGEMVR